MVSKKKNRSVVYWIISAFVLLAISLILQQGMSPDQHGPVANQITRKGLRSQSQELPQGTFSESKIIATQPAPSLPSLSDVSTIDIEISPDVWRVFQRIKIAKDEERSWQNINISFNQSPDKNSGKLKLHGWTSLATPKKSVAIKLRSPIQLGQKLQLKRFFLLNMVHDQGLFQGWFSFSFLGDLGLFPNDYRYVTVTLNGQPQGVYLLVERTQDALIRNEPGLQFVVRRRTDEGFVLKYSQSDAVDSSDLDALIKANQLISPEEKRKAYEACIDLEQYMAWLTFNSLVEYPDSLDELFLYQVKDEAGNRSLMKITGWDYDQLFHPPARPENVVRSPLFSGAESHLAHFIASHPKLLSRYTQKMEQLLRELFTEQNIIAKLTQAKVALEQVSKQLPVEAREKLIQNSITQIKLFQNKILDRRKMLLDMVEGEGQE